MKKIHLLFLMLVWSSALLAQNTCYTTVNKTYSETLRLKAERGDSYAMNDMGSCLDRGDGIAQNHAEALKWFKKSAEAGCFLAQYNLGYYYYEGRATGQDFAKALYWFDKAVNGGKRDFAPCEEMLGRMYYGGEGTPQNYEKALYWFEKAANHNTTSAQYETGRMYYEGKGTDIDYEKALYWYRRAADKNFTLAFFYIGQCYEFGRGVEKDESEAFRQYQKAAEQKLDVALFLLGNMYYSGTGTEQDKAKALSCYEQALNEGFDDKQMVYFLGVEYYAAMNTKAITYLQATIDSPDVIDAVKSDALQMLSACYRFGRCGVTADENKADELMRQAAAYGDSDAEKIQKWLDRSMKR